MAETIPETLLKSFRTCMEGWQNNTVRSFMTDISQDMRRRILRPNALPCLGHLDRLEEIALAEAAPLVRLLARHRESFRWGQTYTAADFGPNFVDNYGWLELFGTRGHFANERIAAGFLILGPNLLYPDHHHAAEEIYIPLTGGTEWRKGESGFRLGPAGEVIHHPSNVNHAMRTGAEPLLALYLWRGGPLAQKSTVTGAAVEGRH